jgi:hypothetical protein
MTDDSPPVNLMTHAELSRVSSHLLLLSPLVRASRKQTTNLGQRDRVLLVFIMQMPIEHMERKKTKMLSLNARARTDLDLFACLFGSISAGTEREL